MSNYNKYFWWCRDCQRFYKVVPKQTQKCLLGHEYKIINKNVLVLCDKKFTRLLTYLITNCNIKDWISKFGKLKTLEFIEKVKLPYLRSSLRKEYYAEE